VKSSINVYKEQRTAKIQSILDNSKDVWVKEDLEVMSDVVLDKVSKSITVPADYSGQGGSGDVGGKKVEVLLPMGVEIENK